MKKVFIQLVSGLIKIGIRGRQYVITFQGSMFLSYIDSQDYPVKSL